jgi:hypothetical protein
MLTKKQIWRRTKSKRGTSSSRNISQELSITVTSSCSTTLTPSPLTADDHTPLPPPRLKSILSHGNLTSLQKPSRPHSHPLRFSSTVHVLLIPSRLEILSQSLNVYYLTENYLLFKREAIQEIRDTAKQYNLSIKLAMNFLYQPNYELPSTDSIVTLVNLSPPTQGITHKEFLKNSKILETELKFLNDVKTDVELQEQRSQSAAACTCSSSSSCSSHPTNIVTRSGTASGLKHTWVVQWKAPPPSSSSSSSSTSSFGTNPSPASSLSSSHDTSTVLSSQ